MPETIVPIDIHTDLDDPVKTVIKKELIANKPFLRRVYADWYHQIQKCLIPGSSRILEVGSGPGFLHEVIPGLITSDILPIKGQSLRLDCHHLPFRDGDLNAIVMVDVFHHIPNPILFLSEMHRVLSAGGQIIMIEPWLTPLSRIIYKYLHYEPCDPNTIDWSVSSAGPLSWANIALPWIVFARDKDWYTTHFSNLQLLRIELIMPLTYLASGGLSSKLNIPISIYPVIRQIEKAISFMNPAISMFALIVLQKDVRIEK